MISGGKDRAGREPGEEHIECSKQAREERYGAIIMFGVPDSPQAASCSVSKTVLQFTQDSSLDRFLVFGEHVEQQDALSFFPHHHYQITVREVEGARLNRQGG